MGNQQPKEAEPATASEEIPTECQKCSQTLEGEYTKALGLFMHPECFTCQECDACLAEAAFLDVGGKPFCEKCFAKVIAEKCRRCGGPIVDGTKVTAQGETFHSRCLVCCKCGKSCEEVDQFFTEIIPQSPAKEGQEAKQPTVFFCGACSVQKMTKKGAVECGWCHQLIEEHGYFALGKHWHAKCFICFECGQSLHEGGGRFFEINGKIFCRREECVFARQRVDNKKKRKRPGPDYISPPRKRIV